MHKCHQVARVCAHDTLSGSSHEGIIPAPLPFFFWNMSSLSDFYAEVAIVGTGRNTLLPNDSASLLLLSGLVRPMRHTSLSLGAQFQTCEETPPTVIVQAISDHEHVTYNIYAHPLDRGRSTEEKRFFPRHWVRMTGKPGPDLHK